MIQRVGRFLVILLVATAGCGGDDDGGGAPDAAAGAPDATPAVTVTVEVRRGSQLTEAALLAFRDGDGDWQVQSGGDFAVTSGRYSVALVCVQADGAVRHQTLSALTDELTLVSLTCDSAARTAAVSGSVAGLGDGQAVDIALGAVHAFADGDTPTYEVMAAPGTIDAVLERSDQHMLLAREVDLSDGADIDFDLEAGGFDLVVSAAELTGGLEGEFPSIDTSFVTDRGDLTYIDGSTDSWFGAPASQLEGNDIHIIAANTGSSGEGTHRTRYRFAAEPGDLAIALPAPIDEPTLEAVATAPYVRLSVAPTDTAGMSLYQIEFFAVGDETRYWNDRATAGWLDGAGADGLVTPDLSGLDGWDDSWGVATAATLRWFYGAFGSERGARGVLEGLAAESGTPPVAGLDGLEIDQARRDGALEL
jgi:hypothetical protein